MVTRVFVLAEHFELQIEVATVASVDELIEQTFYYQSNPAAAAAIADRGRRLNLGLQRLLGRARRHFAGKFKISRPSTSDLGSKIIVRFAGQ